MIREQDKGDDVKAEPVIVEENITDTGNKEYDKSEQELVLLSSEEIRAVLGKNEARRKIVQSNIPVEEITKEEKGEEDKKEIITEQEIYQEEINKREINLDNYYLYDYVLESFITIDDLAVKFAVSRELILEANKDLEVSIGASIKIPVDKSRIYIMEKGDTLWKIHTRYGVSVEQIKELNNIKDESNIPVGTVIIIPE